MLLYVALHGLTLRHVTLRYNSFGYLIGFYALLRET